MYPTSDFNFSAMLLEMLQGIHEPDRRADICTYWLDQSGLSQSDQSLAHYHRGLTRIHLGQSTQALDDLLMSRQLGYPKAYKKPSLQLLELLTKHGRWDDAQAVAEEILKSDTPLHKTLCHTIELVYARRVPKLLPKEAYSEAIKRQLSYRNTSTPMDDSLLMERVSLRRACLIAPTDPNRALSVIEPFLNDAYNGAFNETYVLALAITRPSESFPLLRNLLRAHPRDTAEMLMRIADAIGPDAPDYVSPILYGNQLKAKEELGAQRYTIPGAPYLTYRV